MTQIEIAALEKRAEELRAQLIVLEQQISDARLAGAGIAVGDVVRSTSRRWGDGALFRVCRVEPASWRSKAWIAGNPQRKDGSFGTGVRNLFSDWEKV